MADEVVPKVGDDQQTDNDYFEAGHLSEVFIGQFLAQLPISTEISLITGPELLADRMMSVVDHLIVAAFSREIGDDSEDITLHELFKLNENIDRMARIAVMRWFRAIGATNMCQVFRQTCTGTENNAVLKRDALVALLQGGLEEWRGQSSIGIR